MKRLFVKGIPVIVIAPLLLLVFFRQERSDTIPQNSILTATIKTSPKPLPLYGLNGDNDKGPSWTNKAFRDSAAALNFKIIRYPGGSLGEYWDWKKGWFIDTTKQPQNSDIALPQAYRKTKYSPTGLPELKLLVDETHCDVVFDLNMVTKDLDDQIEMLKTARTLGIPVKWIELGNEYNIKLSPGRKKFDSPGAYGRACNEWISTIKENFPDAEVAVIGGNKQYAPDVKDWNDDVLKEASKADGIVAHLYAPATNVVDNNGINFERLYNTFRNIFNRQGFDDVKKPVWVTEYNIQWAVGPAGDEKKERQQYAYTWGQALSTILMTSMATSLPKGYPPIILDHNISNWSAFAAIETENGTFRKLPNGIGFGIWSEVSSHKTSMASISFDPAVKDFEVLGWQFDDGNKQNADLLVNFTANTMRINISSLNNTSGFYKLQYADKNAVINGWKDIHHERKAIANDIVELPAYSVAIL